MAKAYNEPGYSENYEKNKVKMLSRGGKERGDVRVEGSYSGEIRGFKQPVKDPMNLIVVMDEGFAAEQPECLVSPVDKYINIPKGFYIPALDEKSLRDKLMCRDILEIHGALGNASTTRTTGYTVYVWDKPKTPVPSEDDKGHLVLKMPQNSVTAKDGAVDGYILTIEPEKGEKIEEVIMPAFFEKEVKIDIERIYGKTDRDEPLTVKIRLCEFIRNGKEKILGEMSDAVNYTFGDTKIISDEIIRLLAPYGGITMVVPDLKGDVSKVTKCYITQRPEPGVAKHYDIWVNYAGKECRLVLHYWADGKTPYRCMFIPGDGGYPEEFLPL